MLENKILEIDFGNNQLCRYTHRSREQKITQKPKWTRGNFSLKLNLSRFTLSMGPHTPPL